MTIVASPQTTRPQRVRAPRDRGIDLVRAVCLAVVVALHSLMVGVSLGPSGPIFENAAEGHAWFIPLSWFVQVMPLFFIVGGFSTRMAYRSARERGVAPAGFIAGRVQRLLGPAIVMIAVVGAVLLAMTLSGIPADMVAEAGFRISQPLWFLGVYLLCQALAPALIAAHERAPWITLAALALGVAGVDAVAAATGIGAVSFLNLAGVWLLIQQLGFWLADGRVDALSTRARIVAGLGALAALFAVTMLGVYPANMYAGLNPPSAALVLLGVVQLAALSCARPWLRRIAERSAVREISTWINARSMTIYLWHMPVLIALAGIGLVGALSGALPLPEPGTAGWWLSRPFWIGMAFAVTAVVAQSTGRWERRAMPAATASTRRAVLASIAGVLSVIVLLVSGITVVTAIASVLLMRVALTASANPPVGGPEQYQRVMPATLPAA
ncbi:acyltransferase family protein [Paramicrobacterium agarici]|uniref:Peptidoglycan/LPS O-acetylase OafA/YrhL n=1 Tax=Paramicrobacterium agarici TaxID=630514 RepID=A0A2A9DWX0_9MICO|nr:acyltransferase [Microbacterium agarici]PFG30399.1 peptidoglycan/LPS O-acetylase OafA/YrhL [Microbacterium agarici]